MAANGMASPKAEEVFTRAHAPCHEVGETSQRLRVLQGVYRAYATRGQLGTASELSQQLLGLAQCQPDTDFLVEGHCAMGAVAFYRGDFVAARTHLEQSVVSHLASTWRATARRR